MGEPVKRETIRSLFAASLAINAITFLFFLLFGLFFYYEIFTSGFSSILDLLRDIDLIMMNMFFGTHLIIYLITLKLGYNKFKISEYTIFDKNLKYEQREMVLLGILSLILFGNIISFILYILLMMSIGRIEVESKFRVCNKKKQTKFDKVLKVFIIIPICILILLYLPIIMFIYVLGFLIFLVYLLMISYGRGLATFVANLTVYILIPPILIGLRKVYRIIFEPYEI